MHLGTTRFIAACAVAVAFYGLSPDPVAAQDGAQIARGRYVVKLGGCNDCHTADFGEKQAKVPENDWLEGSALGFHGPWGTTYAVNLRLLIGGMTEAQWLEFVRTMQPMPPMPWWSVRWMTRADQRAVYAYIRHLGPAGKAAPSDLPPGVVPPPPYLLWPMPQKAAAKTPG